MARARKARPNYKREVAQLTERVVRCERDATSFALLADALYEAIKERFIEDVRQEISEALDEVVISH